MLTPVQGNAGSPRGQTGPDGLSVQPPDLRRVAVLLNRNARRVTDKLAARIERLVGSDHLFYTKTLDEAEAAAREVVQRGYGTVACGGGDGTLVNVMNLIQRYVRESNQWRQQRFERFGERQSLLRHPRFAFLRLGTGNGISRVVGASDAVGDLQRIIDYVPGRTWKLPLVECEDDRFFFCGLGYDSVVLNDYNEIRSRHHHALVRPFCEGVLGYFTAVLLKSIPRILLRGANNIEARITTKSPAYYVDPRRGDCAEEIEAGSTIFEGRAEIISAGSSPFFGYNFHMFPFARISPNMMQLRVANIGPLTALSNLPSIWKGSYRNPDKIFDFLVRDVRIELSEPFPFQHSGDAQGLRRAVDLKVSDEALELVDLHRPRRTG